MRRTRSLLAALAGTALVIGLLGCPDDPVEPTDVPLAEGIYGPMGTIIPTATDEQRATFILGEQVAERRFAPGDGLGPLFNVTFCAACHEKPVFGGSAGHYRDFYIQGQSLADGTLFVDARGGVVAAYGTEESDTRPMIYPTSDVMALRNPIPFFGVGLLAELPDASILANADPDDADGDGISGRPNWDDGFVGRFGRKSQTVSIEGFIRGPLFNHLGMTTDPLTEEQLDALPVPSGRVDGDRSGALTIVRQAQASAPSEPLEDDDGVADPEMSGDDLFALVSWSMLLAAPEPEPLDEAGLNGQALFAEVGCDGCHVPSLVGPRGRIPLYSDLLLHDMGDDLADGLTMGAATGSEFRTQPLWGVVATGPYLHDGRADTLEQAIILHGGEAEAARDAFEDLQASEQADVVHFLGMLGGADEATPGLIPPSAPVPAVGSPGGPFRQLDADEEARFLSGRALFDRDMGIGEGLGPHFNGDSCRACHFDPAPGGAGPLDVNVMRHGTWTDDAFEVPGIGTILSKLALPGLARRERVETHNVFEPRQTPSILGLGLIETIPEEAILALADPDDEDGDGVRGVAHVLDDGRLGRFGWKGGVPSLLEFARDALSNEVGLTVPENDVDTFGFLSDDDEIDDPEIGQAEIDDLVFFMATLAPPAPRQSVSGGLEIFEDVGCGACHVPELAGADGPVPLFSDLLLHDVAPPDRRGIPDGDASERQFRTPPLWGLADTGPYMHDGRAETVADAIEQHEGEAESSVEDYDGLSEADRATLIEFLENL